MTYDLALWLASHKKAWDFQTFSVWFLSQDAGCKIPNKPKSVSFQANDGHGEGIPFCQLVFFNVSFLSQVGLLATAFQKSYTTLASSSLTTSTFLLVWIQLEISPRSIFSLCLIAWLILFLLRITSLDKDFFALDSLTFFPEASDLKALKAAWLSLDPDCLTYWSPSFISFASAFKAFVSFSSSGILTNPSSSKIFLVLGHCLTVFNICAFFLGVAGSTCRTLFWRSVLKSRRFVRCQGTAFFYLFTVSSYWFSCLCCALIFVRLSCSTVRVLFLISFTLILFWVSFIKPHVYEGEVASRLCLCLSLVFYSNYLDSLHNMPFSFLFSAFLFSLAFFAQKTVTLTFCWIHLSLGWTWFCTRMWKNGNDTPCSLKETMRKPWNCQKSTPFIDIKHVWTFRKGSDRH